MTVTDVRKDPETLTMTLDAEFEASPDRVWQLWADPRQLERWLGPPAHPATVEKHDLAPGGEITFVMAGPDGEQSRGLWRVTHVDPPASLEFTDAFADDDGTPNTQLATSAVQVRLRERDGRTRMELRFTFESSDHMRQYESWGTFEALPQSVSQMDAVLVP